MAALPPILCYHKVDARFELGVTRLGPRAFARQLDAFARAGWTALGSSALLDAIAGAAAAAAAAPERRMVLTFDDGYAALAEAAFPALAAHGFPALVFVITDFVGGENAWDVRYGGRAFRHLSWEQLGRWRERGIEVHAHGATHRRLTWLSDGEAAEELGRSREAIARELGAPPAGICYPFGAVDGRIRRLASEAGFTLGFAGPSGGADPLALGRRPVYAWDGFAPPLVARAGVLGGVARGAASAASRFAVVTSALKRVRAKGPAGR